MQSLEAMIEKDGRIRFRENLALSSPCRVIVTFLEPLEPVSETALLSESALAEDWNRPEEDEAWARFQPVR